MTYILTQTSHYGKAAKTFANDYQKEISDFETYEKFFLKFEDEYSEKLPLMKNQFDLLAPYEDRLSWVNETFFKIPETDVDTKIKKTLDWIHHSRPVPKNMKKTKGREEIYTMCLKVDLASGKNGFGGKPPPFKLKDSEISMVMKKLDLSPSSYVDESTEHAKATNTPPLFTD